MHKYINFLEKFIILQYLRICTCSDFLRRRFSTTHHYLHRFLNFLIYKFKRITYDDYDRLRKILIIFSVKTCILIYPQKKIFSTLFINICIIIELPLFTGIFEYILHNFPHIE